VDSTRPRDFSQDTIEFLTATAALIGAFLQSHRGELSEAARLAAAAMQAQSRDVLLREMQHRVKNSFQIILASIAIQKRRYAAGDAQRALDHITSRINANEDHAEVPSSFSAASFEIGLLNRLSLISFEALRGSSSASKA
jgi:hypothetical protein